MKTKIQIKSVLGNILYEYESEENSIKKTVEEAVKEKANLRGANLTGADLSGANLTGADLRCAYLRGAYLSGANLRGADLRCANLRGANLRCAYLRYANLEYANLRGAVNIPFIPLNLPEGGFIAYKKIENVIVKLRILEDSKRSRATGDKCRCDKALVLELQDMDGNKLEVTEIFNGSYATCTYKVGEIVEADKWDDNRWNECSHGIHFFLDRQSAVDYEY